MLIAKCSLGHVGLVTDYKKITYPNGETTYAYTGKHIFPLNLIGKPWSSRKPKKVL